MRYSHFYSVVTILLRCIFFRSKSARYRESVKLRYKEEGFRQGYQAGVMDAWNHPIDCYGCNVCSLIAGND